MSNCYVSSGENNDQGQSSSAAEKWRVEPTSVPVFIAKLYTILSDNTVQEMVSWSNDGERFCVYDISRFSKVVLPQHFKHNNWPSFVRQLNMYGFHKMNDNFNAAHGRLICEFHHPLFYQNGRRSLRKIRRNSKRATSTTSLNSISRPHQHHQQHLQHQSQQQQYLHHGQQSEQQVEQQYQQQQQYQHQHHNIQCQQQLAPPTQEPSQSASRNTASSSYIPILSLLSSNQDYDDDKPVDCRDQSNDENNEIECQGTCMTDDDEGNTKGKNRENTTTTITNFDNNENNNRGYVMEGGNSHSMNINNLTTDNYDCNDNDKSITMGTTFTNRDQHPIIDVDSINMDGGDNSGGNHRINNDERDDTDCQYDMDNNSSMDEVDNDNVLPAESYMILTGRLNQLRRKTTDLNSEAFLLRRCVAQLQQSVVVLLNCLSDAISCSDLQDRALLDKIQVETTNLLSNGKNTTQQDRNEPLHILHDHRHHHHYYQDKDALTNEQLDDFNLNNYDNDIDIDAIKKGIRDILHRSRQGTEMAKKNHHMHLHPQGYDNWDTKCTTSTPLDTNNNNKQQQ